MNMNMNIQIPLEKLTSIANSYAAANGLQVEVKQSATTTSTTANSSSSSSSSAYQCAPISLLPNAFPSKAFADAKALAPYFNVLVDRISRRGDFLRDTLAGTGSGAGGVISKDEYTKKLLELYVDIYMNDHDHGDAHGDGDEPNFAKIADRLGITRSDYMLNPMSSSGSGGSEDGSCSYGLKQVELNTIAASFAGLAVNVAGLHRMLTERFEDELKVCMHACMRVCVYVVCMFWCYMNMIVLVELWSMRRAASPKSCIVLTLYRTAPHRTAGMA